MGKVVKMVQLILNHLSEIIITGIGSLVVAVVGHVSITMKRANTSLKAFAELPGKVCDIATHLSAVSSAVQALSDELVAKGDLNPNEAEIKFNTAGELVYVTRTFSRWLGVERGDLLGYRWLNYVKQDQRQKVKDGLQECINEDRPYHEEVYFGGAGRDVFKADMVVVPVPDEPPTQQWIGIIRKDRRRETRNQVS
jgi:PAS domain S-box-containing protein